MSTEKQTPNNPVYSTALRQIKYNLPGLGLWSHAWFFIISNQAAYNYADRWNISLLSDGEPIESIWEGGQNLQGDLKSSLSQRTQKRKHNMLF